MKILYICTHNRCRSVLSEAITNHLSQGRVQAFSAGSEPAGEVHPLTLKFLQEKGISTEGLKSQSWDDFESIEPDVVVTVCDHAAKESCPVWFGNSVKIHWGLPDPSKLEGNEEQLRQAFFEVMSEIENRVNAMLALDLDNMGQVELKTAFIKLSGDQ